jgi:hypothetical protein
MNLRSDVLSLLASFALLTFPAATWAQATRGEQKPHLADTSSNADAESLKKKATDAQARINANEEDRDQLKRAIKVNEVSVAKEVLLRNGFSAKDLENAKIILRTGGGKGGKDEIEISATCCDPREIIIQRSLDYFTK